MTPADLARLRELEGKATKGEWRFACVTGKRYLDIKAMGVNGRLDRPDVDWVTVAETPGNYAANYNDAELICALRNAAPALFDAAERLEQIRKWAEKPMGIVEMRGYTLAKRDVLALLDAPTPKGAE